MTLQQCRYILALSEHQSMSRAAQALYVTQPTISKAIMELELELDIRILERNSKGITFTKEGIDVLYFATSLIEQSTAFTDHFKGGQRQKTTRIGITSQHYTFAVKALSDLVNILNQEHPSPEHMRYEVIFHEGKSLDVINDVADGTSLLGILALTEMNRTMIKRSLESKSLVFNTIKSVRQHIYLSKRHPLASAQSLSLEQLMPYPRLTYKKDDLPQYFAEEGNHLKYAHHAVFVNDRATMDSLLAHTEGYNIGTGYLSDDIFADYIQVIPLENGHELHIGYVTRAGVELSKPLQLYLKSLSECL